MILACSWFGGSESWVTGHALNSINGPPYCTCCAYQSIAKRNTRCLLFDVAEGAITGFEQELAATHAPPPLIHPNLAEVYRQRVERLHEALQDSTTRDEAFELTRSLVDEIRLRVELRGDLAGILALAANRKKPDGLSAAGLAEQIKMVAGEGFEPSTFRYKLAAPTESGRPVICCWFLDPTLDPTGRDRKVQPGSEGSRSAPN